MLSLRPMTESDLAQVGEWIRQPHVATWWIPDTTVEAEVAEYRERIEHGKDPATHLLTVEAGGTPVAS